jgi:hypothetical protein
MPAFGPGTITFGTAPGVSFAAEVTGGAITHSYDETERKATLADTARPAARKIPAGDTLKFDLVNDLTADGYYAYAYTNHLQDVAVEYVPSTASGAKWAGTVTVLKPDEIGATEWGSDLESSVELPFTAPVAFTPAGATAPAHDAADDLPEL